jgi:hypothetical protein
MGSSKKNAVDGGHKVHQTIKLFPLALPVSAAPEWHGQPIPIARTAKPVRLALKRFRLNNRATLAFRFAFSRWLQAQNGLRRTREDAVVDLAIALESIFILPTEFDGKAKLLRKRLHAFWYEHDTTATRKEKDAFVKQVDHAYNIRSRVAHGDIPDPKDLEKAQDFLNHVLRTTFGEFIYGRLSRFNPLAYWKPPKVKLCKSCGPPCPVCKRK